MSLQQLLDLEETRTKKQGLSQERLKQQLPNLRNLIAFYRQYPDYLVDFMLKDNNPQNFHFYFYQRNFLRTVMRHRYVYATFPRA